MSRAGAGGRGIWHTAATLSVALASAGSDASGGDRIALDRDFRTTMNRYAVVDRADGVVYDLYINDSGLDGWRDGRRLGSGTVFAIESFAGPGGAADGTERDAAHRDVHLSMKSEAWASGDAITTTATRFGEPTGPGTWRMAGVDPRSGEPTPGLDIAACHDCHLDRRAEDFILSRGLLDRFLRTGRPATISFACAEREICFGVPER